jgi:hypothetical protein
MQLRGFLLILFAAAAKAQTVPLVVNFQLTDMEYKPLAGQPVRLIFGEGQDWHAPNIGYRIITAADGRAQFTANVILERRWKWVNVGFTPFSVPRRTDHLQIAAELEQVVPAGPGGRDIALPVLYRMDVDRFSEGSCSTYGFVAMYTPDGTGRFTNRVPPSGFTIPDSGGLVLRGEGYTPWDYLLESADQEAWKIKLAFKRYPPPVRRL